MASDTIICNQSVCPIELIVRIVISKSSWCPAWFGGVTLDAICCKSKRRVVGIGAIVKVLGVAVNTKGGGALEAIAVALITIDKFMGSCQWKLCGIVIKCHVSITTRMACKAGIVHITIPRDAIVIIVCFWIGVTGDTTEYFEIIFLDMTLFAFGPFPLVFAAVNRKVRIIVLYKRHRNPPWINSVAFSASIRKSRGCVIWILGICEIIIMTRYTLG